MNRQILICTVGTSLLNNLKHSSETISQLLNPPNHEQLVLALLDKDPSDRLCGAEINSITSICKKKFLSDRNKLIFLTSDSDAGRLTGTLLLNYYQNSRNPFHFKQVEARQLEGLRPDNVEAFKKEGLKNLVIQISKEARAFSSDSIAINATGGYKAQISFAGMIAQALEIPVYYLFEQFSEVIELPPQPLALDLGLWLEHYAIFEELEQENAIPKPEDPDFLDEQVFNSIVFNSTVFNSIIEEVEIDGIPYLALTPMGLLFNERCVLQFPRAEMVLLESITQDTTPPEKKSIKLRKDHGVDVLKPFAKKINQSPYVKGVINSLPFNPEVRHPIKKISRDGTIDFVLHWTDKGLGMCIQTTGRTKKETATIALHLVDKFCNG